MPFGSLISREATELTKVVFKEMSRTEALLCIAFSFVSSAFHVVYYVIGLLYHFIFRVNLNFLKDGFIDSTIESSFNEG